MRLTARDFSPIIWASSNSAPFRTDCSPFFLATSLRHFFAYFDVRSCYAETIAQKFAEYARKSKRLNSRSPCAGYSGYHRNRWELAMIKSRCGDEKT